MLKLKWFISIIFLEKRKTFFLFEAKTSHKDLKWLHKDKIIDLSKNRGLEVKNNYFLNLTQK